MPRKRRHAVPSLHTGRFFAVVIAAGLSASVLAATASANPTYCGAVRNGQVAVSRTTGAVKCKTARKTVAKALSRSVGTTNVSGWSCRIYARGAYPSGRCKRGKSLIQWELNDAARHAKTAATCGRFTARLSDDAVFRITPTRVDGVSCQSAKSTLSRYAAAIGAFRTPQPGSPYGTYGGAYKVGTFACRRASRTSDSQRLKCTRGSRAIVAIAVREFTR
jgi:hypothetical protein